MTAQPLPVTGEPVKNQLVRVLLLGFVPAAALVVIYGMRISLGFLSVYGVVAVGRVIVQSFMAAKVRRTAYPELKRTPFVSIVVAAYNEDLQLFKRGILSLVNQKYPNFEVVVVDDGSDDPYEIRDACRKMGVKWIRQRNQGKRHALMTSWDHVDPRSEYILTGDSDTIWDEWATADLVETMESSRSIGAATGHVATLNEDDSWLTKLTAIRYWFAFEIERASQSMYGGVTCVSGPLGIYRRSLIDRIKQKFISQRFLGSACTYGDDRHLSNLILAEGYEIRYSKAIAWTDCPARLKKYLKQQARWGRSFWREQIWTFKALGRQSPLLAISWFIDIVLPFLFVGSVGWYIYHAFTEGWTAVARFFFMLIVTAMVRATSAIAATGQKKFLLMPVFALFHIVFLMWLKFWSLATMWMTGWGTRKEIKSTAIGIAAVPLPAAA